MWAESEYNDEHVNVFFSFRHFWMTQYHVFKKTLPEFLSEKNMSKFVVMMILDASPEAGRWRRIESIEASH